MSLRHVASVLVALSVLTALASLAGSGLVAAGPALGTVSPEIHIASPLEGAKIEEHDIEIEFHVTNFTLNATAMGGANVPGEGHVHVFLDGNEVGTTASSHYQLHDLAPGEHHVWVELYNNDHTFLDPRVHDEVGFDAERPHLSVGHPQQSAEIDTFEVEVEFHVEHFSLEEPRQQANAQGHGHIRWRVLKDGVPVTADPVILWKTSHTHAELKAPGCILAKCVYVLEAWLANNDGTMVEGTEKLTSTFTVLSPNFTPVFGIFIFFFILMGIGILWAFMRQPGEKEPKREEEAIKGLETAG